MWQKCPICNGTGIKYPIFQGTSSGLVYNCTVCDGHGIISELTGLPPKTQKPNSDSPPTLNYDQYKIGQIADDIQKQIDKNLRNKHSTND